jgi:hypothetical protein
MHKCSHCGEILTSISMACPLCGMMSATSIDELGFKTSFEAVKYFQEELARIESHKVPTMFILLNRPNKYVPLVAECSEVERKLQMAFSMYAVDTSVANVLQGIYTRIVRYRASIEKKFSEIDTLFKGCVIMILFFFGLLSSFFEKVLVSLGDMGLAERLHHVTDALNHTALSFIFVGFLIYLAATSYNTKKKYYG